MRVFVCVVAGAAALSATILAAVPAGAVCGPRVQARAAPGGSWGPAREVAGDLNQLFAEVTSISCASAGNCSAVGYYRQNLSTGQQQAFAVGEVNGTWGAAQKVVGALNTGAGAALESVSCASAGNCGAAGFYDPDGFGPGAFVVSEVNGTWGPARQVAGTLNTGQDAQVNSISCTSPGNCSAGGYYEDVLGGSSQQQAFAVSQVNGTWGTVRKIADSLHTGGYAAINSVSCTSPGNCSGGGYYITSSSRQQAFAASQVNSSWGIAREVTTAVNTGGYAAVNSVSCTSPGNYSAAGYYLSRSQSGQAFVISQTDGTWGTPQQVAATLNTGGSAQANSVFCTSAARCGAGGYYRTSGPQQAFVVNKS